MGELRAGRCCQRRRAVGVAGAVRRRVASGGARSGGTATSHRPLWCQCAGVAPVGPVDRSGTGRCRRPARRARRARCDLAGDLVQPVGAADADVAGLGHDQRPPVARPRRAQQLREAARGADRAGASRAAAGADLPLAAVVVVHADQVERAAACRRARARRRPSQHVPGLPLEVGHACGLRRASSGAAARRHHVHHRLDVEEARARVHGADRVACRRATRAPAGASPHSRIAALRRRAPAVGRTRAGTDASGWSR